ncbi:hypothetical protein M422DRAFT_267155 [Sphaerobolus stellatus SS14]|uniref:Uncharacterized protein n=1 Tax=Sphaerobolus stellatus (strain SS14) TaxID=990650 RepID=A0A0C9U9K0_SPHS4|nr:hypothetical protein M422DRAFT_267155 [Sphaerobolus stellatus SS14]
MIRAIYFTSALITGLTVLAQDGGIIGGITSAAGAVGSTATSLGGDVTSARGTVSSGVTSVGSNITSAGRSVAGVATFTVSSGTIVATVVSGVTVLTSNGGEGIIIPASLGSAAASDATSFYQSATSVGPTVATGSGSDSNNAAISLSGGALAGLVIVVASVALGALVVA